MNRLKILDLEEEIVSKSHRYNVEGVVGEGAYGVVLKCCCKKTAEIVAIKKFKDTEDDESVRKTILREVKILRMLKHPNIVSLLDAFRRKKRLYLVFEFLQRNLLQVLEDKPLGLEQELIRVYIFQLVEAIRYCHQHEIVHRDIKPENLLVNLPPDPTLKLCDFGFARTTVQTRSSQLTDYVATRWYRAPELLLGIGNYGKPVDIWAIGCIMAELIDSQPLFPGQSDIDQLFVIRKVLGPLTEKQREMFLHNPRFLGMKLPEIGRPETLQRRYFKKITKSQLKLMKNLLEMDERQRFTIDHVYESSYFTKLREKKHSNISSSSNNNTSSSLSNSKNKFDLDNTDNKTDSDNNNISSSIISHSTRRDIMQSRNAPITPPLTSHNNDISNNDNNSNYRKRRVNNDRSIDSRGLRSRHIKHRKKKHKKQKQRQHHEDENKDININNNDIENNDNNNNEEFTPPFNNFGINHINHHLPNVNVNNIHYISSHNPYHHHSRRGNKPKRNSMNWNRRTSQHGIYPSHHGINLKRDTQTTGGEPISSRPHYNQIGALPQLTNHISRVLSDDDDNNNNNTNDNDERTHLLRSRKSDRRSRVSSFAANAELTGYKQRSVGFTFSRYQHSRKLR